MRKSIAVLTLALLASASCGGSGRPAPKNALTVFELRRGMLRPVVVQVAARTPAAAVRALGIDAPLTVDAGTATVGLRKASDAQVAAVVFTLMQFPTVRRVDIAGRHGLVRGDFATYLPPIFVERPAPGARVAETFQVSGTASVFEATLVVQALRDGNTLLRRTVNASEGAPARGTFLTTLSVSPGPLTLRVFAPSAADGKPQHEVDVSVVVGR